MQKILPWERTFDNLKNSWGNAQGMLALGSVDEVVSCLYSFHGYDGYDVIFLNCVEEGSKQCENWNDVIPVR